MASNFIERDLVRVVVGGVLFCAVGLLSACVVPSAAPAAAGGSAGEGAPAAESRLSDLSEYDLPTPQPVIVPDVTATVNTDIRANVRSGPDLNAAIVAKAQPGETLKVVGKSEDGKWWQVCCVAGPNDEGDEKSEIAWLAAEVTDLDGNVGAVPVVEAVLPEDLTAEWAVDWQCGSERCEVKQCNATVTAKVDPEGEESWLEVTHEVVWDEACKDFAADPWAFQVDRYTGKERSGEFVDNFVYNYWMGAKPGPATDVFTLDDGRKVAVYCSGPHEIEQQEGDNWTTVYRGTTCHDVRTGELVSLDYTKRWLFTGEFDGQSYERAYFGDYETLLQYLTDTDATLDFIQP